MVKPRVKREEIPICSVYHTCICQSVTCRYLEECNIISIIINTIYYAYYIYTYNVQIPQIHACFYSSSYVQVLLGIAEYNLQTETV